MKKKYSTQEIEDALNAIDVSDETKKTLEADFRRRNESITAGYIGFAIGLLIFSAYFFGLVYFDEIMQGQLICFWVGLFFMAHSSSTVKRVKMRRAAEEMLMKINESEPAVGAYGENAG